MKKLRKRAKLTQVETSRQLGKLGLSVSDTLLSQYENNVKVCNNFLTLKGIAIVFDCKIDDLYDTRTSSSAHQE